MTNQNTTQTAVLNTLEDEGKALAKIDKQREAKARKVLKADIQPDGYLARLGKLMFALKQEANGRISTSRLKECGIDGIDKRRRSEALWFIENEQECRAFIEASRKGFTSLTALKEAMRNSAKADEQPEADIESNVGPTESETQEQSEPKTAGDIALEAILQAELHNVSIADLEVALQDAINLLKEDNIKAVA
tara:strand:- start:18 stop:596 length:579 start_codon:yes stop_codon:yes gene_type:complete